jgi:hypothetical protein
LRIHVPQLHLRTTEKDHQRLDALVQAVNARRKAHAGAVPPRPSSRHEVGLAALRLGIEQLERYEREYEERQAASGASPGTSSEPGGGGAPDGG